MIAVLELQPNSQAEAEQLRKERESLKTQLKDKVATHTLGNHSWAVSFLSGQITLNAKHITILHSRQVIFACSI